MARVYGGEGLRVCVCARTGGEEERQIIVASQYSTDQ